MAQVNLISDLKGKNMLVNKADWWDFINLLKSIVTIDAENH